MLDAHCHLNLYKNPSQTAQNAERSGVFVVCVTNLPSAFLAAWPYVRQFKKVRLALGLHPLNAALHSKEELDQFKELVSQTSFIGEIGLDFSREGNETRDEQLVSFRFALRCLQRQPKFITIHSRQAESAVLELLQQEYPHPVVFHWYSGTARNLDVAIDRGHFFSINPPMLQSIKTRNLVARIPHDRALTESDGPFVNVGPRSIVPSDVQLVEDGLADMWSMDSFAVRNAVAQNFQQLVKPLKRHEGAQN